MHDELATLRETLRPAFEVFHSSPANPAKWVVIQDPDDEFLPTATLIPFGAGSSSGRGYPMAEYPAEVAAECVNAILRARAILGG